MNKVKIKNKISQRRARRTRKSVGVSDRPRLSVFRSNRFIYAQIINDQEHKTLYSANSKIEGGKTIKTEAAKKVGTKVAKLAKEGGISQVVFDRGRYKYHGRIKALAEGAREAGLDF